MKEWIKKLAICLFIFAIIYIVLYNFIEINTDVPISKDINVITTANKNIAVAALSLIGLCCVIEIYSLIRYINKTVSPETFKSNIIKLVIISIVIVVISTLSYIIYLLESVTRIAAG